MPGADGPYAFLSYVHKDDETTHGAITRFREELQEQIAMHTGDDFQIFQDREIAWGADWEEQILGSLDSVGFLIAIVTPRFFRSEYCRKELARFAEREQRLDRGDLVYPVLFVDVPGLSKDADDELMRLIASRQRVDWRELKHEPFTAPEVRRQLERLAMHVRDAIGSLPVPAPVPAPVVERAAAEEPRLPVSDEPVPKSEAPTLVVDPSVEGAFGDIRDAIAAAEPGSTILIRPGHYVGSLLVDKALELIGHGERGEIILEATDAPAVTWRAALGRLENMTLRADELFALDAQQGRLHLEGCDLHSAFCGMFVRPGVDPVVRRNAIYGGGFAVLVGGGRGTFEDNDLNAVGRAGLCIAAGATTTARRNRIRQSAENGILVGTDSTATLEDNEIVSALGAGVLVTDGAHATARRNRVARSGLAAVEVDKGGGGLFEDNDLRDNAGGAFDIAAEAGPVECSGNLE